MSTRQIRLTEEIWKEGNILSARKELVGFTPIEVPV